MAPLRVLRRRNWFYRRLLKGKLPDHIAFHPYDALPRRLEDADALLSGRFRFAGETVDAQGHIDLRPAAAFARLGRGAARVSPGCRRSSSAGGDAARDAGAPI